MHDDPFAETVQYNPALHAAAEQSKPQPPSAAPPTAAPQSVTPSTPSAAQFAETVAASPAPSKEELKSAYVAFKKRWKLTKLDQESRIGRGPMSSGQKSTIVGIEPPRQYPTAVWEALVEQGKLKRAGHGQYAMA
jgi:hypothetical protein